MKKTVRAQKLSARRLPGKTGRAKMGVEQAELILPGGFNGDHDAVAFEGE